MKQSLVRTVAEGTFFSSFTSLGIKAIGLVTVFVILRSLGAAEYGVLELALSMMTLLSIFTLPGLDSVVIADAAVERGKGNLSSARGILFAYFILQCGLAFVAWAVLFFGSGVFGAFYQLPGIYAAAVSFLFLISPLQGLYGVLFKIHLKFVPQSLLTFFQETGKLSILLVLAYFFHVGVLGVIFSLIFSQILGLLLMTPYTLRLWRGLTGGAEDGEVHWWSFLWGHGAWSILNSYVNNIGKAARLWIIQRLLGSEAVGLYAVASGLMGHTVTLAPLWVVLTPLLPQYVHDKLRFSRLLIKGIQYQLLANAALAIGAFIFFPPIIGWLFPQYVSALPLFEIMLLSMLPGAFVSVVTPAFAALKLQRSLFWSMALKAVATVVFSYFGILFFGLWGVALEPVLSACLQGFERLRSLRKNAPELVFSRETVLSFEDDRIVLRSVRSRLVRSFPFVGRLLGGE